MHKCHPDKLWSLHHACFGLHALHAHSDVQEPGTSTIASAIAYKHTKCRPMINKPPPFKGLNIRIPIIIPIKGRGFLIMGLH